MKQQVLADTLRRAGARAPTAELVAAPEPFRYRIRGEFHIIKPKGGVGPHQLGFNRRRTYDVVPIDDCLIHHNNVTDALPGVVRALEAAGSGKLRSLRLTAHPVRRELLWQGLGGETPRGLQEALTVELGDYLVHQDSLSLEYDGAAVDGRPASPWSFASTRIPLCRSTTVRPTTSTAGPCSTLAIGRGAWSRDMPGLARCRSWRPRAPTLPPRPRRLTMIEDWGGPPRSWPGCTHATPRP